MSWSSIPKLEVNTILPPAIATSASNRSPTPRTSAPFRDAAGSSPCGGLTKSKSVIPVTLEKYSTHHQKARDAPFQRYLLASYLNPAKSKVQHGPKENIHVAMQHAIDRKSVV